MFLYFYFNVGGADSEIFVWKANFAQENLSDSGIKKKNSEKPKIRPSLAGGMQGVDVQRVVASLIAEDKQDIEDADIKPTSSTGSGEMEMNKRIMELNIGENRLPIKETESGENNKSVIKFLFKILIIAVEIR